MSEKPKKSGIPIRGFGRGPGGHAGLTMPVEKAKDFRRTLLRLIDYLKPHKLKIVITFLLAIGSSLFLIISPKVMLMYGKEASNRKQEIDRQHYTIPNQRPKDKHCGKI